MAKERASSVQIENSQAPNDPDSEPKGALKLRPNDFTTNYDSLIFNSTTVPHATVQGDINPPTDVDFFQISAKKGELITLDIDFGYGNGDFLDTQIWLFDHKNNLLASNDDFGGDPGSASGLDSYLTYEVGQSGQYFIAVNSYNNDYDPSTGSWTNSGFSTGDYTLHVSVGDPVM